jgi:hypothetical protein
MWFLYVILSTIVDRKWLETTWPERCGERLRCNGHNATTTGINRSTNPSGVRMKIKNTTSAQRPLNWLE